MSDHAPFNHAFEVDKLNVWISGRQILKIEDVKIPKNSVFTIMGPSGSGKSTFLKVLNRLIEINPNAKVEGKVRFNGIDIFTVDATQLRRKVGMVFQNPNPFPHMSVFDNIAYPLKVNKIAKAKELQNIVINSLKRAYLYDEVKGRLNAKASTLSGGQQQRLTIARALALNPEVLLMDEPTSMIDVVGAKKIEELILELKKEITVILVSHTPQQAQRVSDYVCFLYDGKVVECGTKEEVFDAPKNELTSKYVLGKI
jgi:phosphate transport system ATP-binding protein